MGILDWPDDERAPGARSREFRAAIDQALNAEALRKATTAFELESDGAGGINVVRPVDLPAQPAPDRAASRQPRRMRYA